MGRDDELRRLDDAWDSGTTNIISAVAEGGAGKSALVNEWLGRLQLRNYGDAEAVLDWSFFSQGSKEQTTSAEGFLNWAVEKLCPTFASNTMTEKARAIAEALATRRILILLDGVEPLQHGSGPDLGKLKDQGLRELLRRVAVDPPDAHRGLIVITSRAEITDIDRWRNTVAPVIDLEKLSDEAGAALLSDNGVRGTHEELKDAARVFGNHALALSLLSGFLTQTEGGDVRKLDRVDSIVLDDDDPRHAHAKRIMQSYANKWLTSNPAFEAIISLVSLFDRPADAPSLSALRRLPIIYGLTDSIKLDNSQQQGIISTLLRRIFGRDVPAGTSSVSWDEAIARLRSARLLLPADPRVPDALDAHPLVREWFGERLRKSNEKAWRDAHGRLYEHLRDMTKEGKAPTLEDLAPLYQAVAHGCRAGRHQEALDNIYVERICREDEFYSKRRLGAFGSDLAAISWFFDSPFRTPVTTLKMHDQAWILGEAAVCLRAQVRFEGALEAQRSAVELYEREHILPELANQLSNLSQTELLVGQVATSLATAARGVQIADLQRFDLEYPIVCRTDHADALTAARQYDKARQLFAEAEQRQAELHPEFPLINAAQSYRYCELLFSVREWSVAQDRAQRIIESEADNIGPLYRGITRLALGRALLGSSLQANGRQHSTSARSDDVRITWIRYGDAVDALRAAGISHYVARVLLARAVFRRSIGDWRGAALDLDEVAETAEPGPMRLHLCDMALERARLAFARIEAFAPLNGMLEKDNPPTPEVLGAEKIAELKAEAEKQIKIADDYIRSCGYHRRDEELAELQAVLRGERTFAGLPPRV